MPTGGTRLYRSLEQLLPGVLMKRRRSLRYENGDIVPTMADLQPGASEVVRQLMQDVGDASVVSDASTDIPMIDVSGTEDRYKTIMIGAGFSLTLQQQRALDFSASESSLQLLNAQQMVQRLMSMAQRAIAEKANLFGAFGSTALGITGFLNNANVAVNNSSFNPYTATPEALAEFFIDEIAAIHSASNTVETPGDVVVSTDLDFLLQGTKMSDGDMTVKQYILQNYDAITSITPSLECGWALLEANGVLAGGTNKDRIVFYPRDMEVVERHIEPSRLAPEEYIERRNLRTLYPMFHCVTPTIINYPTAMRYTNVAKRA